MSDVSDYNSYSNSLRRQQDSYETERAESRANNEKEIQKVKSDYEKNLTSSHQEYAKQLQNTRTEAQDEVRRFKEEMYDSKGKRYIDDARSVNDEKQQLSQYKDQIDDEAQRKVDSANESADSRAETAESNESRKIAEALNSQKKSHVQQLKELKQGHERFATATEQEIQRHREKDGQLADHFSQRANEIQMEASDRAEQQIRAQKNEFSEIDANHQQDLDRMEKGYQAQLATEKHRSERGTNFILRQNNDSILHAMNEKDARYQDYLKSADAQHTSELQTRDEQITKLKTTGDERDVSPLVLAKVQNKADQRVYKESQALNSQNQVKLGASRDRDIEERREMKNDFEKKYTEWNKGNQKNRDLETKSFLSSYQDLQSQKDSEVTKLQSHQAQVFQATALKHAQDLNLQQQKNVDEMDAQRENFHAEKSNLQDDLEFQQKTQDREWTMKYNDVRRDYEKKLSDERDQHEMTVGEIKLEYDKKLRDQDRRSSRLTDDRIKAYEYQIKQQELAFKEKERFLTEHYEEELDKMKHTNARILQTKS